MRELQEGERGVDLFVDDESNELASQVLTDIAADARFCEIWAESHAGIGAAILGIAMCKLYASFTTRDEIPGIVASVEEHTRKCLSKLVSENEKEAGSPAASRGGH